MDFSLIRVDSRLVHGQIIETWLPFLKATRIVVVNDEVAGSFFRETVIRMAVPREAEVLIYGVDEFGSSDITRQNENVKTIVLFSGVDDVARAWVAGFRFKTLNIGNLYSENCKLQCSTSVCLADEDMAHIRFLLDSGVSVEMRSVPSDRIVDFRDLLRGGQG
jgi:mannose/fructose/N-acetylgalactosamine-specific phosphotransferase system component IIB